MKNKGVIKLIEAYQKGISPNSPPKCRFYPTCSAYAKECYQKFNFFYASFLTTKRFLKCNRLFKGGYDPVPLSKEEKKKYKEEINQIEKENKEESNED